MTFKKAACLFAASISAFSVGVSAQDNATAGGNPATEGILPPDLSGAQLAQIFEVVVDSEDFGAAINPMMQEMMTLGPPEKDWNTKGIYLPDFLEARGGDLSDHILVSEGKTPFSLLALGDEQISLPKGYRSWTLTSPVQTRQKYHALVGFAPDFWIGGTAGYTRKGNAMCSSFDMGFTLYSTKNTDEWGELELGASAVFYALMDATAKLTICEVYYELDDGTITSRIYTAKGQPFTAMNAENDLYKIRPATKATDLIRNAKISNPFAE